MCVRFVRVRAIHAMISASLNGFKCLRCTLLVWSSSSAALRVLCIVSPYRLCRPWSERDYKVHLVVLVLYMPFQHTNMSMCMCTVCVYSAVCGVEQIIHTHTQ